MAGVVLRRVRLREPAALERCAATLLSFHMVGSELRSNRELTGTRKTLRHFSSAATASEEPEGRKITVKTTDFLVHRLQNAPEPEVETTKEEMLEMYRKMSLIRRMEITADMLYKRQLVRGFCHLYDGQEAVAVGMEAALTYDDAILAAYRQHGTFVGRGGSAYEVFCELMGRTPGPANGKGGSMHLYKREHKYFGGWGIVGTSAPLGAGLALGQKVLKEGNVSVATFGDGAANQGQMYEAFNMAALWRLPVLFAVENNHFGMGTSEARASAQVTFYDRLNYMPGIKVDGMDAFAIKKVFQFGREYAKEHGPLMVECDTYRYHGHSMSDPGSTYRTRAEIQGIRKGRDPISRMQQYIVEEGVASEDDLKAIDKELRSQVEEDAKKAENAPFPDESELWTNVYCLDKNIVHHGVNRRETGVKMG